MRLLLTILISSMPLLHVAGQEIILQKGEVRDRLIQCFDHIYNSDTVNFPKAAKSLEQLIPNHPANNLLKALSIYWAKYPLDLNGSDLSRMKTLLKKTVEESEAILDEEENNFEVKYVDMIAHAMLALSHNRDNQFFKAAGEAKKAYNSFRDGFELMDQYEEFKFSSGLYSYYREKYPEIYPIYKSIIWLFKNGDKVEGINLMKEAVEVTTFARAEAAHYVGHILLRYEKKPAEAIRYVKILKDRYPNNLFFRANYIENLFFLKRYEEAKEEVSTFPDSKHAYYQMAKTVFLALLSENEFQYEEAETLFNYALEISERGVSEEMDNLKSLCYSGLARLSLLLNNDSQAKAYYKKALKEVKYELYQEEPKEYLDLH